jgi:4-aminobutyrate aminotransferase-like enzyme
LLTLPPTHLTPVLFGRTPTDATEPANRIARAYTGNRGVIATRYAYHGNTGVIAQLSPSYVAAEDREDWVELVAPPDTYRAGVDFLAEIDGAIERLASRGIRPAALLLDAAFTSDGMFPPSHGLLADSAKRVRAAGGIYIADEVQSGFARFGATLWGFQRDDVVPEIVTLGKPIGNGHPLSATVVNENVLDAFSSRTRYFNTFGGNPVSAAVGLAVLEVFQREKLAENSFATGDYLHSQLRMLAEKHRVIGDIRGCGLFAGVDLVQDRLTKEPATGTTKKVVNMMRERGVLISMIGPEANVLKIRPPLPFQRRHVDHLVQTLGTCLREATRGGIE